MVGVNAMREAIFMEQPYTWTRSATSTAGWLQVLELLSMPRKELHGAWEIVLMELVT
jgi:hypothetical protein